MIFGTPLVVPCDSQTPRKDLYACVWKQVQRLIIPDPPDRSRYDILINSSRLQARVAGSGGSLSGRSLGYRVFVGVI